MPWLCKYIRKMGYPPAGNTKANCKQAERRCDFNMRIFNTLSGTKEEFVPISEGKASIYACGPTVYDYFHIGNARPFIIFDTLRRYLEYQGYQVTFVQNFTDIDDKMIRRANQEGITVAELGERFIAEYKKDAQGLGIRPASVHPRATQHIPQIIQMIETLEKQGFAYEVDGDVYFRTKKCKDYGKLSHQPLEDLEAGARISVDERKEDAMDFAVWKKQKEGEPAWDSPWGMGRPGWHIECSVMANQYLGKTIDIHCGGRDLIFPHHENEIAQSECCNGVPFAHYWMHNGYINIDNKKMSKSTGNFFTVRDIAKEFDYPVIRMFMLSAHYRSPINFSKDLMRQAKASLERIETCINTLTFLQQGQDASLTQQEQALMETDYTARFEAAMDDDLNTADALSVVFDMVRDINTLINDGQTHSHQMTTHFLSQFNVYSQVLGLFGQKKDEALEDEIAALIQQRQQARKAKNFQEADRIRDLLKEQGILLEDTPQGVKWKRE